MPLCLYYKWTLKSYCNIFIIQLKSFYLGIKSATLKWINYKRHLRTTLRIRKSKESSSTFRFASACIYGRRPGKIVHFWADQHCEWILLTQNNIILQSILSMIYLRKYYTYAIFLKQNNQQRIKPSFLYAICKLCECVQRSDSFIHRKWEIFTT